jgi:hypothetical protein
VVEQIRLSVESIEQSRELLRQMDEQAGQIAAAACRPIQKITGSTPSGSGVDFGHRCSGHRVGHRRIAAKTCTASL